MSAKARLVDAADVDVVQGGGHGLVPQPFLEAVITDEIEGGVAEGSSDHDCLGVEDVEAGSQDPTELEGACVEGPAGR